MISSYPVRFSTDVIFSSLVSFAFFVFLCVCVCVFFCFFLNLEFNIYSLSHILLCGQVNDEKIFIQPISGNNSTFFGLTSIHGQYGFSFDYFELNISVGVSWSVPLECQRDHIFEVALP